MKKLTDNQSYSAITDIEIAKGYLVALEKEFNKGYVDYSYVAEKTSGIIGVCNFLNDISKGGD